MCVREGLVRWIEECFLGEEVRVVVRGVRDGEKD